MRRPGAFSPGNHILIIAQGAFHIRPGMALKDIIARGRQIESEVLVKAVKLYLGKRLDVYWGVVKEV
jgi:formyltetrahydrofolate hydrolase